MGDGERMMEKGLRDLAEEFFADEIGMEETLVLFLDATAVTRAEFNKVLEMSLTDGHGGNFCGTTRYSFTMKRWHQSEDGVVCLYECPDCRHNWETTYLPSAYVPKRTREYFNL